MSDIERSIVKLIVADWDRFQHDAPSNYWSSAGQMLDAVSGYLVEYLIWKSEKPTTQKFGKPSVDVRLWYDRKILEFGDDGRLVAEGANETPSIADIFYVDNVSEFDFETPRDSFHSKQDEENLSEFGRARSEGYEFLDRGTYRILEQPKLKLSSISGYRKQVGLRDDWEYEFALGAWERVRAFSGGRVVYCGSHPSKIAQRVLQELKRVRIKGRLPKNGSWRADTAAKWARILTGMPPDELKRFSRADLAEHLTGERDGHRKVIRNLWNMIKDQVPSDVKDVMEARGPKRK